jgi:hypothetical protein
MSSIIRATTTNGLQVAPDNSGSLVLQTNGTNTALTIDTSQNTTLAGKLTTASSGIQFSDSSIQTAAASPFGLKNRIINGAMQVWQRGTSFTFSSSGYAYCADRWASAFQNGTYSQSTDVPTNNAARFSLNITTGSGAYNAFRQRIESYNSQDLSGQTVTISFWAKAISGGSQNLVVGLTYPSAQDNWTSSTTIQENTVSSSVSSSWTQYTTTFTNLPSNVTNGLELYISLGSTSSAQIRYTLVQLEIGTSSTPFERRLYGQELALCQRYYQVAKSNVNVAATSSSINGVIPLLVQLRSDSITVGKTSGTFSMGDMVSAGYTSTSTPTDSGYINNSLSVSFNLAGFSSLTSYRTYRHEPNSSNPALFTVSAEL